MKYFVMIVIALTLAACDPALPSDVTLASYNYPQDGEIPTEGTVTAQQDSQTQTTSGTISNEQDFDAVAIAQTVESDASCAHWSCRRSVGEANGCDSPLDKKLPSALHSSTPSAIGQYEVEAAR